MTWLAMVIVLFIERHYNTGLVRQWRWYDLCASWCSGLLTKLMQLGLGAVAVLVPVSLTALLQYACLKNNLSLIYLCYAVVLLWCCLGPVNLWFYLKDLTLGVQDDEQQYKVAIKLLIAKLFDGDSDNIEDYTIMLTELFYSLAQQIVMLLFWFILLGPAGAVLYRLVHTGAHKANRSMMLLLHFLEYVPSRLLGIMFALVGDFVAAMHAWREYTIAKIAIDNNKDLIGHTACAALKFGKDHDANCESEVVNSGDYTVIMQDAALFFDRVIVIILVISLMF